MYRTCRHIKPNGLRCESPALRSGNFCYYHSKTHIIGADPNEKFGALQLPTPEDASAVQLSLLASPTPSSTVASIKRKPPVFFTDSRSRRSSSIARSTSIRRTPSSPRTGTRMATSSRPTLLSAMTTNTVKTVPTQKSVRAAPFPKTPKKTTTKRTVAANKPKHLNPCSRPTVHGPQSTIHGPRFTVHGSRSTALSPRSEAHGSRLTAHYPRFTAHGPRSTVHDPRSQFPDHLEWTCHHVQYP